ncbi:gastrula zinc finger protein XlCGF57.1 isoform X1 [Etheostoma spectabile]|uniref:gastrula zinc finger protein XlCGF57.1 isoform X1 n=1 Tax=Etheostoma spectabile TaxID=54343 RepID=UPI0013AFA7B1|nr:gastrula zinc finger protein XlCGF57.1-like isoform X1 [Etheostoma spectabile]
METEADGEDCGGPEPARNSHPLLQPETEHQTGDSSEPETDDSADWKETREPQSALNSLKHDSRCKKTFSCSECGRRFGRKSNLYDHIRVHTQEKKYSCNVCNKRFVWRSQVKKHKCLGHQSQLHQSQTEEKRKAEPEPQPALDSLKHESRCKKTFTCSECGKRFGRKAHLKDHIRIHTGEKPFSCSVCKKCFRHSGGLRSHMVVHTRENIFTCSVCNNRFANSTDVKRHKCVGPMDTNADGEDCGRPEPARNSHPLLQPETEDQTRDSSETETGDSADWNETREPQSGLNSLKHDSGCKKTFSCSECGRRFGQRGHLKRHMITHTGEKPFSCSECGKAFTESGTLKRHIKTHTGERPYTCSVCKKSFTQRGSLRSHMVVVHTGEKPFSCPVCQLSFSRRQYLQRHLIIHKGGRLPCCSVCSKGFTSSGNLKRHMMTHTGERPFSCSVCKKSFSERGGLKRHMITHKNKKPISSLECGTESSRVKIQLINHTGEKLFSCSVCQKSFTQRDRLQRHVRIHTGEKKYSCNSCEQTFAWSTSLKIHQCLGRQPETGDQTGDSSDPEADDSADWKETREPQSALNSLKHDSRRKKTFSCSECGGGFAKRGHLLDHIRIHSGERPFSCSVCQQSFKQSGHLYKHMSIHRKEGEHGEEEL